MGNTVNDAATQEVIDKAGQLVSSVNQILKERARRKAQKDDYKLHKIDAKQQAKFYRDMTDNFTQMPQKITYTSDETKLAEYVIDELERYNKSHSTRIPYEVHKNRMGQYEVITNQKGVDKCYDFRIKFAIERGGKVGEIPTDKFDELSQGKQVTVLKNITEEQYNYISRKTWNNKNNISYTVLKNPDGTLNVAVISQDYMAYSRKSEDIYTALVTEKLTYDKIRQEADKYEIDMEKQIFSYDKSDPMYITSARSGGQYLKVEKDNITIMRPDGNDVIIKRPDKNASMDEKKNFAIDVYAQLDKIPEPLIVGEKTKEILTKDGQSLEIALDAHSKSGKDSDLVIGQDKYGIDLYERPIVDDTRGYRDQKKLATEIAHTFRDKLCYAEAMEVIKPYIEAYKAISDSNISDGAKEEFNKNFAILLTSKTAEIADGELSELNKKQMDNLALEVLKVSIDKSVSSPEEMKKIEKIAENINKQINIDDPKNILTEKRQTEIKADVINNMKNEIPKITNKEVDVKDLVGYSKNFATSMQKLDITSQNINDAINTASEVYEMPKESIYITPDQGLYEILENGLNEQEKKEFKNINQIHDRDTEAKLISKADQTVGRDVIRSSNTETRMHKNIEERETTDTEEITDRSI